MLPLPGGGPAACMAPTALHASERPERYGSGRSAFRAPARCANGAITQRHSSGRHFDEPFLIERYFEYSNADAQRDRISHAPTRGARLRDRLPRGFITPQGSVFRFFTSAGRYAVEAAPAHVVTQRRHGIGIETGKPGRARSE